MPIECKLIDFVINEKDNFQIQMFGIDQERNTYSVMINDFSPFVYIKVGNKWTKNDCDEFIEHLKTHPDFGYMAKKNIVKYEMVQKKTLYGFDEGKYYNFIYISCKNMFFIHKLKSLYYDKDTQKINIGYLFNSNYTQMYECMVPPLLRFFHIQNISPSGWVSIDKYITCSSSDKQTTCKYEISTQYKCIFPIDKEMSVPYKICSFDIEANSSHGDFPESIKNYKKVAYDIIYYLMELSKDETPSMLKELLYNVFDFKSSLTIDKCFLKKDYKEESFEKDFMKFIKSIIQHNKKVEHNLNSYFKTEDETTSISIPKTVPSDVIQMICSDIENPIKIAHLMVIMEQCFPELKGDEVTFIGSSFVNYGEEKPYLQHCVCLTKTSKILENQIIDSYATEEEVLCAWTELIQQEDPDIIIGYNIFGFDFKFMYERAQENDCVQEFMGLGRNIEYSTELQETSIILASGPYDLKFLQMAGRLTIDVYTYMRKEFILDSYKLDFVSSYLLGDKIKSFKNVNDNDKDCPTCFINSKNIKGIEVGSYVHFEIINNSCDAYDDNKKFKVCGFIRKDLLLREILNVKKK